MSTERLDVVVLGLSITSSWGNGHATNYRGLVRALDARGHRVLFLERDVPWYRDHRDLPEPPWGETALYGGVEELRERFGDRIERADLVVVGSYVPDGVAVGRWVVERARGVTAFYDIDTPITLRKLETSDDEYLEPELVGRYDLYLSFTGGPVLRRIEREFGSPAARAFHCLVDPDEYHPEPAEERWRLGYMGTYSEDRQPKLDRLLLDPARRRPERSFIVAGPQYPPDVAWPENVERVEHLPPSEHCAFYNAQRFTLNVTRERMVRAGWSPGVRLFEAAACGVAVVSDRWDGIETFFEPGREILLAEDTDEVLDLLDRIGPDEAREIGGRARRRVLAEHTAARRVEELERHVREARGRGAGRPVRAASARPRRRPDPPGDGRSRPGKAAAPAAAAAPVRRRAASRGVELSRAEAASTRPEEGGR